MLDIIIIDNIITLKVRHTRERNSFANLHKLVYTAINFVISRPRLHVFYRIPLWNYMI